jgi:hypothetical protein
MLVGRLGIENEHYLEKRPVSRFSLDSLVSIARAMGRRVLIKLVAA